MVLAVVVVVVVVAAVAEVTVEMTVVFLLFLSFDDKKVEHDLERPMFEPTIGAELVLAALTETWLFLSS